MARWVVVVMLAGVGAFMTFDGVRALTLGDYLTPSKGAYAGELGPWSRVVVAVGVEPRSTAMKSVFVGLGVLHLAAAGSVVVTTAAPARWLALVAGISGLWYLPFGTIADLVAVVLIVATDLRPWD